MKQAFLFSQLPLGFLDVFLMLVLFFDILEQFHLYFAPIFALYCFPHFVCCLEHSIYSDGKAGYDI